MNHFRFHFAGLLVALTISLIVSLPPVVWRLSSEYRGVDLLATNTEPHYVTQVQEVYDGEPLLGNPFYEDLKDDPYLFPPFAPNLIARFGMLLGINAVEAVMVSRFLIVFGLAFFVYFATWLISRRRVAALVAPMAVILGYGLVDPAHFMRFISGNSWATEGSFIDYGRPVNPSFSSLVFFAYLSAFLLALERKKGKWIVIAGCIFAVSFYTYLFTWTFILALNGVFVLAYFFKKEHTHTKTVMLITLLGVVGGIPYLLHAFRIRGLETYTEVASRFGFVKTRIPELSRLVIISSIVFLLSRKMLTPMQKVFFGSFFIAAISVINEHVITGTYLFNHHYHWYYNTPLVIIFFLTLTFMLCARYAVRPLLQRIYAGSLILLFVISGVTVQSASYTGATERFRSYQEHTPLFSWINASTTTHTTFFADPELSELISAYSSGNVYYNGTSLYTLVPRRRLLDSYLVHLYLAGVPQDNIAEYIVRDEARIIAVAYGYTFSFLPTSCPCIDSDTREYLIATYQHISPDTFLSFLKRYPVDYIIWEPDKNPTWDIARYKLPVVFKTRSHIVYEIPEAASLLPM